MPVLTNKQTRFIDEYLLDLNATKAAARAGYSPKTANQQGARLLTNNAVQFALSERMKKRSERTEITQDYVLQTVQDTIERCRQAVPVLDREGNATGVYEFASSGVLKGCELLGKHLKLWTDRSEFTGPDGKPLAPPVINIGFANGGPGIPNENFVTHTKNPTNTRRPEHAAPSSIHSGHFGFAPPGG